MPCPLSYMIPRWYWAYATPPSAAFRSPLAGFDSVTATPRPSQYIDARLVCAAALPSSAALRNHLMASAKSFGTPRRVPYVDTEVVLRADVSALGHLPVEKRLGGVVALFVFVAGKGPLVQPQRSGVVEQHAIRPGCAPRPPCAKGSMIESAYRLRLQHLSATNQHPSDGRRGDATSIRAWTRAPSGDGRSGDATAAEVQCARVGDELTLEHPAFIVVESASPCR